MLKGYYAIVTGATSGIGLKIAERLAEAGAGVLINGLASPEQADAICQRISKESGVPVHFSGADISHAAGVREMIATATGAFPTLDILVNNAGIQHTSPIDTFPEDRWDAVIATNLSAQFHTIKALLPGMKARGFGRIINIASTHGLVASPNKCAYVAAKHGVIGLTKAVALEVATQNITCNAICPGWVLTPLVQKQIDDRAAANHSTVEVEAKALVGEKQPNQRFASTEEIASMVVFLSNPAFQGATGAAFTIDGGWTAW